MKDNVDIESLSKYGFWGMVTNSPWKLLLLVSSTIFFSELIIMLLLQWFPLSPFYVEALFDAAILISILFPVLFVFVFNPMKKNFENKKAEEKIKNAILNDLNTALITAEKRKQKFQNLFDLANDIIIILDPDSQRIIDCNVVACKKIGYSKDEMLSMSIYDLREKPEQYIIDDNLHKLKQGKKLCFESSLIRADGSSFPTETSSSMINIGEYTVIQSFIRDISQRRELEDEKDRTMAKLKSALDEIKTLQGILPMCSFCKKIRNDLGEWEQIDVFIDKNSMADVSHSICPDCMKKNYPKYADKIIQK